MRRAFRGANMPRTPATGEGKSRRNLRARSAAPRIAHMTHRPGDPAVPRPPESRASADTPATLAAYGHDLACFATFLARRKVRTAAAVRSIDLLDYLAELGGVLSARSQARRLSAMRQLFKYLKAERIIPANPAEDVDMPRFGRRLPSFLTLAEVDALLAAPDRRTDRGARDGAMLELLYATGLRVSELVRLRLRGHQLPGGLPGGPRQGAQGAAGPHRRGGAGVASLLRRDGAGRGCCARTDGPGRHLPHPAGAGR